MSVSGDGKWLAVATEEDAIVFDAATLQIQETTRPPKAKPAGKPGAFEGGPELLNVKQRRVTGPGKDRNVFDSPSGAFGQVTSVALSPDGLRVAKAGGPLAEWSLAEPGVTVRWRPQEAMEGSRLVAYRPAGQDIVFACFDGSICIWRRRQAPVADYSLSPEGSVAAPVAVGPGPP